MLYLLTFLKRRNIQHYLWEELANVSALLAGLAWIGCWYGGLLMLRRASWLPMFALLTLVLLSTYIAARVVNTRQWKMPARFAFFSTWMIFWALVTLQPLLYPNLRLSLAGVLIRIFDSIVRLDSDLREVVHVVILLLVVRRGINMAKNPAGLFEISRSFQLGLLLMLMFGLYISWQSYAGPLPNQPELFLALYLFLFLSLFSLVTTRIASLSELRGGKSPLLNRSWLMGTLAIASSIVGIAIGLGWVLSGKLGTLFVQALLAVSGVISLIVLIVILPVLKLLLPLMGFLLDLLSRIARQLLTVLQPIISLANHGINGPTNQQLTNTIFQAITISKIALVAGFLLIIFISILLGTRLFAAGRKRSVEEDGLTQFSLSDINPFNLFKGAKRLRRLQSARRILAAARIRRIYAQLMDICSRLGTPRPPALTPLEYLPKMAPLFPGLLSELALITNAYLKVRYGELPENLEDLESVLVAWQRIQSAAKKSIALRREILRLPFLKS